MEPIRHVRGVVDSSSIRSNARRIAPEPHTFVHFKVVRLNRLPTLITYDSSDTFTGDLVEKCGRDSISAAWTYVAALRQFDERTKQHVPFELILGRNTYDEKSELRGIQYGEAERQ